MVVVVVLGCLRPAGVPARPSRGPRVVRGGDGGGNGEGRDRHRREQTRPHRGKRKERGTIQHLTKKQNEQNENTTGLVV